MSNREPKLLISDILDSAEKIKEYTANLSFENFLEDSKTIDAVIRNFEIIGEAARRLPKIFKESFPSVKWSRVIGFRNRIVHDYMGIDFKIVWRIIQNDIDKLIDDLNKINREL